MMSLKKMIDLYVRYGVEAETWDMLYSMYRHGLISVDNWDKFFSICASWECEGNVIRDGDGLVIYRADESGYWQKVK